MGVVGRGNTYVRWVYIPASTCRQVREQVSYTAGEKGSLASREHLEQKLFGFLKIEIRAGTCKEQDSKSSGLILRIDASIKRAWVQSKVCMGYRHLGL